MISCLMSSHDCLKHFSRMQSDSSAYSKMIICISYLFANTLNCIMPLCKLPTCSMLWTLKVQALLGGNYFFSSVLASSADWNGKNVTYYWLISAFLRSHGSTNCDYASEKKRTSDSGRGKRYQRKHRPLRRWGRGRGGHRGLRHGDPA